MSLLNDQALWQGKFFNGQWQAASQSREAVEVATGQVLGAIGYADGRDIATSAQAAKAAQRDWWRLPYQERQAVMERAADMMVQHQAEIIDWLVKESDTLETFQPRPSRTMEIWYGTSPPCEVVAVAYTSAVPRLLVVPLMVTWPPWVTVSAIRAFLLSSTLAAYTSAF